MFTIHIRKAENRNKDAVWNIIQKVIAKGDTYMFAPTSSKEAMLNYWFDKNKYTYVASINDEIVGTFILKNNQPDLGSHIANASYMTSPSHFGKGIGKTMGEFSLIEAKNLGYKAIQFNCVVKTNDRAVSLWEKIGFKIVGEIPEAFNHQENGLINTLVMWKKL